MRTRSPAAKPAMALARILAEPAADLGDSLVDLVLGEHALVDHHAAQRGGPTLVIVERLIDVMTEHLDIMAILVGALQPLLAEQPVDRVDLLFPEGERM